MKKMPWVSTLLRRSRFLKYVIVMVAGVVLVGFVGDNCLLSHFRNQQKISELQSEIDHYRSSYERDISKIRRLDTDPNAIVEIARERYFMKNDDEDIFVLSDDVKSTTKQYDETVE